MTGSSSVRQFKRHLDSGELGTLRSALGRSIADLYCPDLRVRRYWFVAPSFSTPVDSGYLVIESDWSETPEHGVDYHTLEASIQDHPKDVPRVIKQGGKKYIGHPVSVVEVQWEKSPVTSIAVLEKEDSIREEHVQYDFGLVFNRRDGSRFAIVVNESIAGGVACLIEPVAIEEVLSETRVRLELTK